mmetsp:Transcript_5000/g.17552  ORF Transcript_5000/g.17552 Transcript_5000/m.17552 type:complete len:307 (+) Transcript_5000:695-1615(+)
MPGEGLPKDLRQLGPSEGDVLGVLVQCPDALLQGQEALVDLGPLHPGLLVVVVGVRPALASREVDEADLSHHLAELWRRVLVAPEPSPGGHRCHPQREVRDAVGPGRLRVGPRAPRGSHGRRMGEVALHLLKTLDLLLLESHHVHVLLPILPDHNGLPGVQQVEDLRPVDLVHADGDLHARPGLHVSEEVPRAPGRQGVHGVGLAAACLPEGKAGGPAARVDDRQHRGDRRVVDLAVGGADVEDVVEVELVPLRVFGEVHLLLRLVDREGPLVLVDLHDVIVPPVPLPLVQGPLADAHLDLRVRRA